MAEPEPAWSYTHLSDYETCPKRYYHYRIAKDVIEAETDQLLEGKRLHAAFEVRLLKATPLPLVYAKHEKMLASILANGGAVFGERKMAITQDFNPCGYFDRKVPVWFRTVVDVMALKSDNAAIFDWKTGKPKDDPTQLRLMAGAVFVSVPTVQRIKTALVFVNHGEILAETWERKDVTHLWGDILPRVREMQSARRAQEFPPNPSGLCKKYCAVTSCPYHGRGR